jgi:hypothetical protein
MFIQYMQSHDKKTTKHRAIVLKMLICPIPQSK